MSSHLVCNTSVHAGSIIVNGKVLSLFLATNFFVYFAGGILVSMASWWTKCFMLCFDIGLILIITIRSYSHQIL